MAAMSCDRSNVLVIFVERYPVTISPKLFLIVMSGFRGQDVLGFSYGCTREAAPCGHVIRWFKLVLAIFVEGHPVTISAKLF